MKHLKGDAIEIFKQLDCAVLFHQVNCLGVMGGGIAKQIKDFYQEHYNDYTMFIKTNKRAVLGSYVSTHIDDSLIVGLFGQHNIGQGRQTNYAALAAALYNFFVDNPFIKAYDLIIPKYIGCGLGGGDWNIVKVIVGDIEKAFEVEFVCVEYEKSCLQR